MRLYKVIFTIIIGVFCSAVFAKDKINPITYYVGLDKVEVHIVKNMYHSKRIIFVNGVLISQEVIK